jgi:hypothetical protein
MSHYSVCKTELKDKQAILDALQRMGFDRSVIEVSDRPVAMKMWDGTSANREANIRIKGHGWGEESQLDGLCNDMGFVAKGDGTYDLHIDNYTSGKYKNFHDTLTNYYAAELVKRKSKDLGMFVAEEQETEEEITLKLHMPF